MTRELCVDKYLNVIRSTTSLSYPITLIVERTGKTYLRLLSWLYELEFYDKCRRKLSGVSLDSSEVVYIGLGGILIKWRYEADEDSNIFLIISMLYISGEDVGYIVKISSDYNALDFRREVACLSLSVNTLTGDMKVINSSLLETERRTDVEEKTIRGAAIDVKYIVFSPNEGVVKV